MSLLPSTNNGASEQSYFIENIGGAGAGGSDAPCIKGTTFGTIRVGQPQIGMILRTATNGENFIRGGGATSIAGSTLTIGNSSASQNNIVMADGITAVNGILSTSGAIVASGALTVNGALTANAGLSVSGDLTFTNGALGNSISGYYSITVGPLNCPDSADTIVPQPAGQTNGWYIITATTAAGAQTQQQVSTMAYWNGTIYLRGGCNSNEAGSGRVAFNLNTAHNGILYSNSTGGAQNGVSVNFTKVMN